MHNVDDCRPVCLPYLDVEVGNATADVLTAVLTAIETPTVLFRHNGKDGFVEAELQPLVTLAQYHNAAALLADDVKLAGTLQADGVHLSSGSQVHVRYLEARDCLGDGRIVGACAGKSRHDAMVLGELGADYIGFGVPGAVQDQVKAKATRRDLIAWWAELFEMPCVAFNAYGDDEMAELASIGADFVAISVPPGISADEAVRKIRVASEILSQNAYKETA